LFWLSTSPLVHCFQTFRFCGWKTRQCSWIVEPELAEVTDKKATVNQTVLLNIFIFTIHENKASQIQEISE